MDTYKTKSEEGTFEVGKEFGKMLKKGDIICINGDLGVGKTVFVRGVARTLGVKGYLTSPTFTIVNEYETSTIPLYHLDLYRIDDPEEFYEFGIEEYLDDGIVIIEWANKVESVLPENPIYIEIKKTKRGENERIIRIRRLGNGRDENISS